jgi:hypothetical protein
LPIFAVDPYLATASARLSLLGLLLSPLLRSVG